MSIVFSQALLRLAIALLLGAMIGAERETNEHSAGLRTMALVALGSCLFMIISISGFSALLGTPHVQFDPSRIASYIVAGIGFLGGGSIFLSRADEKVRGLTTAATIWVVAAIGMACGAGMLLEAMSATLLTLVVLVGLLFFERLFSPRKAVIEQILSLELASANARVLSFLYEKSAQEQIVIKDLRIQDEEGKEVVQLRCRSRDTERLAKLVAELRALPDVQAVKISQRNGP